MMSRFSGSVSAGCKSARTVCDSVDSRPVAPTVGGRSVGSRSSRGRIFADTRSGQQAAGGFTLLEAIIALVIFSMGAFALYGWLSTNLHTLARVDAGRESLAAQQSALDVVRGVNPMDTPRGRREIADLRVEWNAELVEPARRGRSQVGSETVFEVGLYRLDVRIQQRGRDVGQFSVRQVGYRQVVALNLE